MSETTEPKFKEFSWCETIRFLATEDEDGAKVSDGQMRDRNWWFAFYSRRFNELLDEYDPDGFMLLENRLMGSSKFGRRFVLPFGGKSTRQEVPDHPFSVDVSASGTVCVEGVYYIKKLIKENEPD